MNRTAKEIRRAFENITPNVLDRVLSQTSFEKGAVTPMKEKKPFIPFALQKIASAAAVVVLLFAIGAVALMILNGRTNPQLSGNSTEPPVESELKLNATKLDKDGNAVGTTQITIHVTKGEDNKITDIEIDPFDGWKGLVLPVDSTTGEKFEIQQVKELVTEKISIATLGGFNNDNRYYFCTLIFTEDFEHLVLCMSSNVSYDAGRHFYAAAAGNDLTAEKILEHFEDVGITMISTEPPAEGSTRLSDLSERECIAFVKSMGVGIPDDYEDELMWGRFVKDTIAQVEEDPDCRFVYSYATTQVFAEEIRAAVNKYYGVGSAESKRLSDLSPSECLAYMLEKGVPIPSEDDQWKLFIKTRISMFEENPDYVYKSNNSQRLDVAEAVRRAVREYYASEPGDGNTGTAGELSKMTPDECVAFLKGKGVELPTEWGSEKMWANFAKVTIAQVEQDLYYESEYTDPLTCGFIEEIRAAVKQHNNAK